MKTAQSHSPAPAAPADQTAPPNAQRPNGGACRCPSAVAPADPLRSLECSCEWGDLIAMVTHLAYGADQDYVNSVAPAFAMMAHDMIISLTAQDL